jgi:hypothetical protein
MIVGIVRFPLPPGTTAEQAKGMFEASVPQFEGRPGLLRKQYLYGPGPEGGGVYFWKDRASAEACYDAGFRAQLKAIVGQEPKIDIFESSVSIDNEKR